MSSYYEKILATGEVKCIDEEIPFEIPISWSWARLGNLIDIKGGKRLPAGYKLTDNKTDHIYIRVSDMQDGTIVSKDLKYITDDVYNQIQNYTIGKDDLYLTIVGSTIGKAGLVPKMFDNMNLTENAVKLTNIPINKYFLLYYVRSGYAQSQFRDNTKQVGQPKLAIFRIANTLVPIPPFAEQTKIVSKIEYTLHLVNHFSNLQEQLHDIDTDIYRDLKKSILQEAIQGKLVPQIAEEGTAKALLELIKAEKQKLVKEGKLKKSALNDSVIFRGDDNKYWEKSNGCIECIDGIIPFEIPSTWCWVRHNQLFEVSGGSQPPKSQFVENPKPGYIRLYQIRDYGTSPMPVYIPVEKANKITKEGDIILARYGGSLGKVFWAKDGAYNVAMAKVVPFFESEFINKQYLFLYYQSNIYQSLVKDHSRSAQAGFNKDDLRDLFFPLPPLEEQKRIVQKFKEVTSIMSW